MAPSSTTSGLTSLAASKRGVSNNPAVTTRAICDDPGKLHNGKSRGVFLDAVRLHAVCQARPMIERRDGVTRSRESPHGGNDGIIAHTVAHHDLSAASLGVISLFFRNDYYASQEAYLFAIAEAMRGEYEAIAAAGVTVQSTAPTWRWAGTSNTPTCR
jgi:hypothetical protein